MKTTPTLIPGLRSPYELLGGLVHFGRMLDKIRLHAQGLLPSDWVAANGSASGFDGLTCAFLRIDYTALVAETLRGRSDEELVAWAFAHGRRPPDDELEMWNAFLAKRGWRDKYVSRLHFRLQEVGLPLGAAQTIFDFIDLDEGRPPRFE